jgi:hypothetical protein
MEDSMWKDISTPSKVCPQRTSHEKVFQALTRKEDFKTLMRARYAKTPARERYFKTLTKNSEERRAQKGQM